MYPIGPCIPYMTLENEHTKSNGEAPGRIDYFAWLDCQPENSVLYVSLGCFVSVSSSQLDEIALGLATSEVRFLWILREQSTRVRELFLWILGFCATLQSGASWPIVEWTRCWKLSSLGYLCSPYHCSLINQLRDSTDKDRLIRREEIARAVKRLMASEEAEMKAIRRPLLSGKRFLIEQSTRVYLRIVIWLHWWRWYAHQDERQYFECADESLINVSFV